MENFVQNMSSPLSLKSLATQAIITQDIPTPPFSLPSNLLEDLDTIKTCEGTYQLTSFSAKYFNILTKKPLPMAKTGLFVWALPDRELTVTREGVDTWRTGFSSWLVYVKGLRLGRESNTSTKSVCWLDGSTFKKFIKKRNSQIELSQEYCFGVDDLTVVETVRDEDDRNRIEILKSKYIKG